MLRICYRLYTVSYCTSGGSAWLIGTAIHIDMITWVGTLSLTTFISRCHVDCPAFILVPTLFEGSPCILNSIVRGWAS